jgi:hypothetical protein
MDTAAALLLRLSAVVPLSGVLTAAGTLVPRTLPTADAPAESSTAGRSTVYGDGYCPPRAMMARKQNAISARRATIVGH